MKEVEAVIPEKAVVHISNASRDLGMNGENLPLSLTSRKTVVVQA